MQDRLDSAPGVAGRGIGAPPSATGLGARALRSLRHRDYRLLWLSALIDSMGGWMELVAVGWLAWTLTRSEFLTALVLAAWDFPSLLSPLGGVAADRFDRRRLLLFGQIVILAIAITITALLFTNQLRLGILLPLMALEGAVFITTDAARMAMVASLVHREEVMNAVGLQSSAYQITGMLGAAGAGVLILAFDVRGVFLAISVFYAAAVAVLYFMRVPPMETDARAQSPLTDLREGFRYLRNNRPIAALLGLAVLPLVLGFSMFALMPALADEVLHVGPLGLGLLNTSAAVGGFIAVLAIASLPGSTPKGRLLLGTASLMAGSLVLFALSRWIALSLALMALVGAGRMAFYTLVNTTIQIAVPDRLRGRVLSVLSLSWGLSPAGALLAGGLAQAWGAPLALVVMGCLSGAATLFGWLRLPAVRRLP